MARLAAISEGGAQAVTVADCGASPSVAVSIPIDTGKPSAKPKAPAAARPQIEFLNGLRGLAALMVVLQHAHLLEAGVNIGGSAVDVFFVLSSFLLTMLFEAKTRQLLARRAGARQWAFALIDYFSKRFLRVYPLFAAVAVLLWVLPLDARARYYTLGAPEQYDLFKVLTFDPHQRFFVFWTLPLEIAYYFLIPLLVLGVCLLGRAWPLAVAPLYLWVVSEGLTIDRRPFLPLQPHLSTFVAGSLAAIVYAQLAQFVKQRGVELKGWKLVTAVRGLQLSLFALVMSLAFHGLVFHWFAANPFEQHEGASPFLSVPMSALIVLELLFPSLLSPLLEWKLLTYAGKVSFSMYLLHPFVLKHPWIENGQETWHDQFFAWFVLVFALATAAYWAIEHPSQLLAQRVSAHLRAMERQHQMANATLPTSPRSSMSPLNVGQLCLERLYQPGRKIV